MSEPAATPAPAAPESRPAALPAASADGRSEADAAPSWPRIRGVAWSGDKAHPIGSHDALVRALAKEGCTVWVDLTAPADVSVDEVAGLLNLHPLIAEDIAERNQRAKFEEVGGAIHLVMFAIEYGGELVTTAHAFSRAGQAERFPVAGTPEGPLAGIRCLEHRNPVHFACKQG